MQERLAIVTATRHRPKYLSRLAHCITQQTCNDFLWIVVHDGPQNPTARSLASFVARRGYQSEWLHTASWTRNFGASPRLLGCQQALERNIATVAFWDDDNYFHPHGVQQILDQLGRHGNPDLMLMPFGFGDTVLPHPGLSPEALDLREVDTANLVMGTRLAVASWNSVVDQGVRRATDFHAFAFARTHSEKPPVIATSLTIGIYDGNRSLYRRSMRLGLRRNYFYWFSLRRLGHAFKTISTKATQTLFTALRVSERSL